MILELDLLDESQQESQPDLVSGCSALKSRFPLFGCRFPTHERQMESAFLPDPYPVDVSADLRSE